MSAAPERLGAWEKALVLEQQSENAFCASWLVGLDQPLDPELVLDALAAIQPAFPAYFRRIESEEDRIGLRGAPHDRRALQRSLVHCRSFEGAPSDYMQCCGEPPP